MSEPLVCRLDALDAEERRCRERAWATLRALASPVQELPDGMELQFSRSAEAWAALAEFLPLERKCCPFFRFSLVLEPHDGPLGLRITGGPGVKALLAATLAAGDSGTAGPEIG